MTQHEAFSPLAKVRQAQAQATLHQDHYLHLGGVAKAKSGSKRLGLLDVATS